MARHDAAAVGIGRVNSRKGVSGAPANAPQTSRQATRQAAHQATHQATAHAELEAERLAESDRLPRIGEAHEQHAVTKAATQAATSAATAGRESTAARTRNGQPGQASRPSRQRAIAQDAYPHASDASPASDHLAPAHASDHAPPAKAEVTACAPAAATAPPAPPAPPAPSAPPAAALPAPPALPAPTRRGSGESVESDQQHQNDQPSE